MKNAKKSESFMTVYYLKRKELIMKNLKVAIGKIAQRFKRVKKLY